MANLRKERNLLIYFMWVIPVLTIILLFIPSLFYIPRLSSFPTTLFPIVAIFYWACYRPDILPLYVIFILGVVIDFFTFTPFGQLTLIFCVTWVLTIWQRHYYVKSSFIIIWGGFWATSFVISTLMWFLSCALIWTFVPIYPILFSWLFLGAFYPLIAFCCLALQRRMEQYKN